MGSGAWSQDSATLAPQSSGAASAWGGGGGGASQAPSPAPPPMPAGPPQIMRRGGGGGVKADEFPTLGAAASAGSAPAAGADGGRASWDADERAPQGAYCVGIKVVDFCIAVRHCWQVSKLRAGSDVPACQLDCGHMFKLAKGGMLELQHLPAT